MDGNRAYTYENIRKLFTHIFKATFGKDYWCDDTMTTGDTESS